MWKSFHGAGLMVSLQNIHWIKPLRAGTPSLAQLSLQARCPALSVGAVTLDFATRKRSQGRAPAELGSKLLSSKHLEDTFGGLSSG